MGDRQYEVLGREDNSLIKAWVRGVELEPKARDQLFQTAKMPFIHKHIAVMPDVHWGMGSTVGSVIPTVKALIPAAIGVDIGCGMMATRLHLRANELPDSMAEIRSLIESVVPHGRTKKGGPGDVGAWSDAPSRIRDVWNRPNPLEYGAVSLGERLAGIGSKHPKLISTRAAHPTQQLGTLGGGNHFIEICLDEEDQVWVMLHSGSRGIGNRIGQYFITKAKKEMERWHISLPDQDLAYLPEESPYFDDYCEALKWAQEFALANREIMMQTVLEALRTVFPDNFVKLIDEAVQCHHNYVEKENHFGKNVWVTRKGAVRARKGDLGIIPGSMGAKSFIVRGKGNPDSFNSCSHGAGRRMGRKEAKRRFTVEDHAKATEGVECRKDEGVLDETPEAYKDIDAVMAAQSDLIEIVHVLKQVVCIKG